MLQPPGEESKYPLNNSASRVLGESKKEQPVPGASQLGFKIPDPVASPRPAPMNSSNLSMSPNLQPLQNSMISQPSRPLQQISTNVSEADLIWYRNLIIMYCGFLIGVAIILTQYLWYFTKKFRK